MTKHAKTIIPTQTVKKLIVDPPLKHKIGISFVVSVTSEQQAKPINNAIADALRRAGVVK